MGAIIADFHHFKQLLVLAGTHSSVYYACLDKRFPSRQSINQLQSLWADAQRYYQRKDLAQAESILVQMLQLEGTHRQALELLSVVYLTSGKLPESIEVLRKLCNTYVDVFAYSERLAQLLENSGDMQGAADSYRVLLKSLPNLADAHYNLARLLNLSNAAEEALNHYQQAISLGIAQPEDALSNMSVILSDRHRHNEAEMVLNRALELNPHYQPALFNLAVLREERGQWPQAQHLFNQLLEQNPNHLDALTHLAHGQPIREKDNPLIEKLQKALLLKGLDDSAKEALHFALGKVLDDSEQYSNAFDQYQRGNTLSVQRGGRYDRTENEAFVSKLIAQSQSTFLNELQPVSDSAPIFICGMFRSGSTLLEQMLAAHPGIVAGGEINFFNREFGLGDAFNIDDHDRLSDIGQRYLQHLAELFPGTPRVTNKRPDNFAYIGLIRAMFPNARFINTTRYPLDNCLSIYFQQFAGSVKYHCDLLDTGHYYAQYFHLMNYWRSQFPNNVFDVSYQQVVSDPRSVLEPLLEFLQLEWNDKCLQFHKTDNRVRTASVWQVRQPLYQRSKGRWNHYAGHLTELETYLHSAKVPL